MRQKKKKKREEKARKEKKSQPAFAAETCMVAIAMQERLLNENNMCEQSSSINQKQNKTKLKFPYLSTSMFRPQNRHPMLFTPCNKKFISLLYPLHVLASCGLMPSASQGTFEELAVAKMLFPLGKENWFLKSATPSPYAQL